LDVITRLLRSDGPATYRGEFFQISEAMLLPRPERPSGPPLLVGGSGPRRTLPFVARYADIWNSLRTSPDGFRENSALLDNLLRAAGRDPGKVKRTLFTGVFFAHDAADLERVLGRMRDAVPDGADKSTAEILEAQRARNTIIGTPEMIAEQVAAFRAAGVEELMLRWTEMDDIHRLRAFSEVVVHFQ
jgi:alkanesulfonate monooxygenase SsuD/methylene tetrahydromethanopterin reductase-like flavin-dependent oxidoreductase (luciferase family)